MQDFNAAGVRLLQALCGPGTNLWAVGDGRQSVYRFRGAEPGLVDRFGDAFGGSKVALDRTYRATSEVVAAFSAFTAAMPGGATSWEAQRGSGGAVRVLSAPTLEGEVAALRDRVEELRSIGVGYGDQAILARTHLALERVGAGLERLGVPVQYLGDLLVRDEVRDLLALLSVEAGPDGLGLLRVATRAPYAVPRADVVAVIRWAASGRLTVSEALRRAGDAQVVGADGARGLELLGRHLRDVGPGASAWTALVGWLFETHGGASLHEDPTSPMRPVAVYQLLRLAAEEGTGRRAFLSRVRRIAALGAGRDQGVVPAEAQSEDAVRLTTVHAAKGLEFAAVHIPMASSRHVPMPHRPAACLPPPELARLALSPDAHAAEERALFFVALSRARDHLTISHARRYDGIDARPSPFLARVGPTELSSHPHVGTGETPPTLVPQPARPSHREADLATYMRCPIRHRYDVVDGFADVSAPSGYERFLRAIRAAVRELEEGSGRRGGVPTHEDAVTALGAAWGARGPVGHPLEGYYRVTADRMVSRMAEVIAGEAGATYRHEDWAIDLGDAEVLVRADRVVVHPWDAVTVQVVCPGRRPDRGDAGRLALLLAGARRRFPEMRVTVERLDPETGEASEGDVMDDDDAFVPYREAIAAMEAGDFTPRPNPRTCPSCPYFFVCGA